MHFVISIDCTNKMHRITMTVAQCISAAKRDDLGCVVPGCACVELASHGKMQVRVCCYDPLPFAETEK